jgi:hypothetical protein
MARPKDQRTSSVPHFKRFHRPQLSGTALSTAAIISLIIPTRKQITKQKEDVMKRSRYLLLASVVIIGLVLAVSQSRAGRVIARQAQDCIKICDETPLSTIVKNVISVVGEVKISNDSDSPIPTRLNGPIRVASSSRDSISTRSALLVTDVFQREVKITLEPNDFVSTATFTVPQNRLLVIEGWAGFAQMGQALQVPQVTLRATGNGNTVGAPVFAEPGGGGWFLHHPGWGGKLYADPDSTVEVRFARSNAIGTATMTLTLTGHFIDQ